MCKLAYIQLIGWGLWCVWVIIILLFVYAFLLGVAAPLTTQKHVSSGVYTIQFGNSIVTTRATLQPPAICLKVSIHEKYKERDKKEYILSSGQMTYRCRCLHCFSTVIQPVRYLRCLSFSEYIYLYWAYIWNKPKTAEIKCIKKCTYCVEFLLSF